MDIGANLVAFVRMDGCPVRRCSIPQRYTPKRKLITMHLKPKIPSKKGEKRFIFQKVGCTDVAMKKARTAALFGFETGMLGKMSQPGHR